MSLGESELREILAEAGRIAEQAAAVVLEGFRTGSAVRKKGRIDLVTEHDLRSEELLRDAIARAFPAHTFVGEEGEGREAVTDAGLTWYVDPLDGTTNFAHGHPFFCISLGLCDGPEALVGVVEAPALRVSWRGARGLGATRNGVPCRVAGASTLEDALCATGFPYDRQTNDDNNLRENQAFLRRTRGIRRCGSAAIDLSMVADGTYDVYWEQRLAPWDLAAGACLVREAGGTLSDYKGNPPDVREGMLVATNGKLHAAALACIAEARAGLE